MARKNRLIVALGLAGGLILALASFAGAQTPNQMTLQIGPAGNALLRGTLVSVGANSLVVTSWGGNWNINVSADTQVMPKLTGTSGDISSFKTGDFIGVQGKVNSGSAWTIDATLVRDRSLRQTAQTNVQSVRATEQSGRESGTGRIFVGTASNVGTSSLTLTTTNGTAFTVQPATGAKILNRNWLALGLSQIQSGDTVRVFGTANGTSTGSTITASVVRDISQPAE